MKNGKPILCLVTDLPIGDFDGDCCGASEPSEQIAPRLYKTKNGWRAFYTDKPAGKKLGRHMADLLLSGADPKYVMANTARGNGFVVRVSPKIYPPDRKSWAVAKFIRQTGEIHPDWKDFIEEHDRLSRSHSEMQLC